MLRELRLVNTIASGLVKRKTSPLMGQKELRLLRESAPPTKVVGRGDRVLPRLAEGIRRIFKKHLPLVDDGEEWIDLEPEDLSTLAVVVV